MTPAHSGSASTQVLYLHGFRSSPQSSKARMLAEALPERGFGWHCPQLPVDPREAIALAQGWIRTTQHTYPHARLALMGSSLGGFYAHWLAEHYPAEVSRIVLLNPAVHPWLDLRDHTGRVSNYHTGEALEVLPEHVAALQQFRADKLTHATRYFLIAAQGDELLDWRDMVAHYTRAHVKLLQGSNHSISDFADHLDEVVAFLSA